MTQLVLKDVNSSATLEFEGDIPRGLTGYDGCTFVARIVSTPLNAAVNVYDIRPDGWAAFFADIASNWRGWDGAKAHESLEGHLKLVATSDASGHIRLNITLRGVEIGDEWRAETSINFEAGQLDHLAGKVEKFFS